MLANEFDGFLDFCGAVFALLPGPGRCSFPEDLGDGLVVMFFECKRRELVSFAGFIFVVVFVVVFGVVFLVFDFVVVVVLVEVDVPRFMRGESTLDDAKVIEIAQLARVLEEQMGWPVDIECAYHGETLYLLQCRPITTLD